MWEIRSWAYLKSPSSMWSPCLLYTSLEEKDVVLLKTGIGKVNAAIGADTVIREFKAESIIFTGVAGAVDNKLNIARCV